MLINKCACLCKDHVVILLTSGEGHSGLGDKEGNLLLSLFSF